MTTTEKYGDVAAVDAVATYDEGRVAIFAVNRSTDGPIEVTIDVSRTGVTTIGEALIMHAEDPLATNSATDPDHVVPQQLEAVSLVDGQLTVTLPAISWTAVSLSTD